MQYFRVIIVFFATVCLTECAKILGIFHITGRSHYQAGSNLMKILAENGHEVTVVSPFGEKNPPKNYRDVVLTGVWDKFSKMDFNMFEISLNRFLQPVIFTFITGSMVEDMFNHTNFQNLMKSGEKFDLVIMENFNAEAVKYVAHHFNAPLIVYCALEANDYINPYQGNPSNPSFTPIMELGFADHMTFSERLSNTISFTYNNLVRVFFNEPYHNRLLHRYYPDAPHLTDISYNVSLAFVNTDPSIHAPLPRVPSVIGIGGFHIRKPKPLAEDLQRILDSAENGVVYFSMGSNLKSKDMPKEKRDFILRTFGKLKQTVIWKFEDDSLPGKPDNVIISNWLPQNDIFAHKNIKLFISHGGVFSTMEAIYHGIPILAIPIFGDQVLNAKRATASGYAKWLNFKTMTEEEFESAVRDLLTDPKYTENVKKRSIIMKDKPISPQDAVNYWVEYVIRHKGADHLRVASLSLSWYQYLLLDVVAFIGLASIVIMVTSVYCLKMLLRICRNKKQQKMKAN